MHNIYTPVYLLSMTWCHQENEPLLFFSRRVAQQQGRIHLPETWQTSGAHWPVLLWNEPIVGPDRTCSSRGCSQSQKARPPTKAVDDAIDLSSVFYWVTTLWLQKTSHELHDRQTGSFFKSIKHQNTRIVRRHVEMGLSIYIYKSGFIYDSFLPYIIIKKNVDRNFHPRKTSWQAWPQKLLDNFSQKPNIFDILARLFDESSSSQHLYRLAPRTLCSRWLYTGRNGVSTHRSGDLNRNIAHIQPVYICTSYIRCRYNC